MYFHVCNWLPLLYSRNWHHNVKQLDFNVKKFKKNWQKKKKKYLSSKYMYA